MDVSASRMAEMTPLKIGNGLIYADSISLGQDIVLEDGVQIGFPDRPVAKLTLGDHIFIGHDSKLYASELIILDYSKIHNNTLVYGRQPCKIGYNFWCGQGCILDCEGGLVIGNGVGLGAGSKVWSHIRHGDILIGNKYLHFGITILDDDVWCVGNTTVAGPLIMHKKSMLLVGSVLTKDTPENTIWGGAPSVDLTSKLGQPFVEPTLDMKYQIMHSKLEQFYKANPGLPRNIEIVAEFNKSDRIQFNVANRTYNKRNWPEEIRFIKFMLPECKYTPDIISEFTWR